MNTDYSGIVSCEKAIEFITELGLTHTDAEAILHDAVSSYNRGGFYVGSEEYRVEWLFDGGLEYVGYTKHPIELYLFGISRV